MPSARYGRPAITPSRRGPWASACSTPSPSRRCTPAPSMARSASRWSISTCITATAPRQRSGPTRICSTARPTRCRSSPAPALWARRGSAISATRRSTPVTTARISARLGSRASCPRSTPSRPTFSWSRPGFDAHLRDPLAQLRLVEPDFAWVTEQLLEVAAKHTGGRLVSTLEGGYDLDALASSTAVHVATLMAQRPLDPEVQERAKPDHGRTDRIPISRP